MSIPAETPAPVMTLPRCTTRCSVGWAPSAAAQSAPTQGGTFSFTITATDSSGGGGPFSGSQAYSLTIAAPTIALSPASQRMALELTRYFHLDVEYWPILDPTGLGESREAKLAAYRQARDQIRDRMLARFGPPVEEEAKS